MVYWERSISEKVEKRQCTNKKVNKSKMLLDSWASEQLSLVGSESRWSNHPSIVDHELELLVMTEMRFGIDKAFSELIFIRQNLR